MRVRSVMAGFVAVLCLIARPASAIELQTLVDADRDAATGCSTAQMPGIEHVLLTTIEGEGDAWHVASVSVRSCAAGVLGEPVPVSGGGWPAPGDPAIVESLIPLDALGGSIPEAMRFGFVVVRGAETRAVTSGADGEPLEFPEQAARRRAVTPPGSPRVMALDGRGEDWTGLHPFLTNGDPTLSSVYLHAGPAALSIRFDVPRALAGTVKAEDDYYDVAQGSSITIEEPGVLSNDDPAEAHPVVEPLHGVLDLRTDGRFTYVHDGSDSQLDVFEYEARRGLAMPGRARVEIAILPRLSVTVADVTVLEDAPAQVIDGWVTVDPHPSGEVPVATFALTASGPSLFAEGPVVTANGALLFRPAANAWGSSALLLTVTDEAGAVQQILRRLTITPVNDAPGAVAYDIESYEDETARAFFAVVPDPGFREESQTITFTTTVTAVDGPLTFTSPPTIDTDGMLRYHSAPNAWGTAILRIDVADDGGTANGGVDVGEPVELRLFVRPFNDAPTLSVSEASISTLEDATLVLPAFATSTPGPLETEGVGYQTYSLEGTGNLNFTAWVATDGALTLIPAANTYGTRTLVVVAVDQAGFQASKEVFVEVLPVNDPPFAVLHALGATEDSSGSFDAFAALQGGTFETQNVTTSVRLVSTTASLAFVTPPATDGAEVLSWSLQPDTAGEAVLEFTLRDDGGTANGGIDTTTFTAPFVVWPTNDFPTFAPGDRIEVAEDAPPFSGVWATGMTPGGPDEAGQTMEFVTIRLGGPLQFTTDAAVDASGVVTFQVAPDSVGWAEFLVQLIDEEGGIAFGLLSINATAVNDPPVFTMLSEAEIDEDGDGSFPTFITSRSAGPNESGFISFAVRTLSTTGSLVFQFGPQIFPNGELVFRPNPDTSGTAVVEVIASDGVMSSAPQTFSLVVRPVNDPPILDGATSSSLEDGGTISKTLTLQPYPADEVSDPVTFALTRISGDLTFATPPSVDAAGVLTYEASPNASGFALYDVVVTDAGGLSSAPAQLGISVTPVNDEPTFMLLPDVVIDEGAGPQLVSSFVHDISAGPADEAQSVRFQINSVSGNLQLVELPTVVGNGDLTFRAADESSGTFTGDLLVIDDQNGLAIRRFNITVRPINDAPSFDVLARDVRPATVASVSVPSFVTNITPGPNEIQNVSFALTADDTAIFEVGGTPSVNAAGLLTYSLNGTPGRTIVTIVAEDDLGGTATKTFELVADLIPAVLTTTPADGQANVPGGADITITFNESVTVLAPSAAGTGGSFVLDCGSGVLPYALDVTSGSVFTLDPDAVLPSGSCTVTSVAVRISDADTDDGPDAPLADHAFTFNVENRPIVTGESFDAAGNVTLSIAAPGVLANDVDPANTPLTVVPEVLTGSGGGSLELFADGSFTYLSAAGAGVPAASENYTYSVTNGAYVSTGVLSIDVAGRYWYVQHDAAAGGDGRDGSPLQSLATAVVTASEGESILVLAGGPGGLRENVNLRNGQSLIGQGVASPLTIMLNAVTVTLLAPASAPLLTSDSGATLTVGTNNHVAGMSLASANGAAIYGRNFGTLTIEESSSEATGGEALDLGSGTVEAAFGTLSSHDSVYMGLLAQQVSGSITAQSGVIEGAAVIAVSLSGDVSVDYPGNVTHSGSNLAISMDNRSAGAVTFGGSITSTTGGIGVNSVTGGSLTFPAAVTLTTGANRGVDGSFLSAPFSMIFSGGLTITTTSGEALTLRGGAIEVTGTSNSITTAGGIAVDVMNAEVSAGGIRFERIDTTGGPRAVSLTNLTGSGAIEFRGGAMDALSMLDSPLDLTLANLSLRGVRPLWLRNFGTAMVDHVSLDGDGAVLATNGTLNGTIDSVTSAGTMSGVELTGVAGSIEIAAGSFAQNGGNALRVDGGSVNLTWRAAVTYDGTQRAFDISGGHTGTIVFDDGTIDINSGFGLGFSNADGSYSFLGPMAIDGVSTAIEISTGSSGTLTFGDGVDVGTAVPPTGIALGIMNSTPDLTFDGELHGRDIAVYMTTVPNAPGHEIVFGSSGTVDSVVSSANAIFASSVDIPVSFLGGGTVAGSVSINSGGANAAFTFGSGMHVAPAGAVPAFSFTGSSDVAFAGSMTQASNAPLVTIGFQGAGSVIEFSGALDATDGSGIAIANAVGEVRFSGATTLHGGDAAIDITSASHGIQTFGSGTSVVNPTGVALHISNSDGQVTYDGSLAQSSGAAEIVVIENSGAGTIAIGGPITASAGAGIRISSAQGLLTFTGTTALSGGAVISAMGLGLGSVTFGPATSVVSGSAGTLLSANSMAGSFTYLGSLTQNHGARLLDISNVQAGGGVFFTGTQPLVATLGSGIGIGNHFGAEVTFTAPVALSGGDAGIDIDGSTGPVSFGPLVTIGPISGNLIHLTGGAPKLRFESPVSSAAGPLLVVENTGIINPYTPGDPMDVTFTATMTKSGNGSAIVLQKTGATVEFLGSMNLSSSGGGAAVVLDEVNRARFASGDLDITTSGVPGFVSSFTWLEVSGSSNEIVSTGAPALDIVDSTVTEGGVTFARVDVDGGARGISVLRTGGLGEFAVNGGTIQNVTERGVEIRSSLPPVLRNLIFTDVASSSGAPCSGADNSGCNAAIHLSSLSSGGIGAVVENVSIDGSGQMGINVYSGDVLQISDTSIANVAEAGVFIVSTNDVDLTDVEVSSSADGSAIHTSSRTNILRGSFGTLAGPLTGRGITVRNQYGPVTIDDATVIAPAGLLLDTDGVNLTNAIVRNNMFDGGGVEVVVAGSGTPCAAVDLDANTFTSGAAIELVQSTGILRLPGYPGPDVASWLSARNGGATVLLTGSNIVAGASCP